MPTSCEKIAELGAKLPEILAGLGLPAMFAGVVGLALPMVDGELAKITSGDPLELDEQLDAVADFVLSLRSDLPAAIDAAGVSS